MISLTLYFLASRWSKYTATGTKSASEQTGSSIATALGAGPAALVMYCARIGQMYGQVGLTRANVDSLRDRRVMVETINQFRNSSTEKGANGEFIEVWKKLEPRISSLSAATTLNKSTEIISALARD